MNRRIGVVLSYVLMILEVLSTLLLTPYILRTLGQAEYGVYRLAGSIVSYLLLLDLGVGNALIRFFSKYRANNDTESCRKFMGVSIIYYGVISFVALVLGLILVFVFPTAFAEGLAQSEIVLGQKLLFVTTLTACVTLLTSPFSNSLIAYEKFAVHRVASIIQIIIKMIFTYILLKLGMGSMGIVCVNFVLTLLGRGCFVVYAFVKIKIIPLFKGLSFVFVKEIIVYSSFILLQMIATQINAGMGQILLGAFVSSSSVIIAVYGIGTQVVQYYQSIGSSITGVLMPGLVALVENKASPSKLCDEMVRIGRIIFMFLSMIWAGFLLFGQQFIDLWAGKENSDAYIVALLLITVYLFILCESVGLQILWAMNKNKEMSIMKLTIVLINVFITLALIKWNPLIGVTLGTVISLLLGDLVVMNILFKKHIKISLMQYYKGLLKGIVPCVALTVLSGGLFKLINLQGWLGFLVNVGFVVIVFVISMRLFGMNEYEKNLISGMLNKLFSKFKKHSA